MNFQKITQLNAVDLIDILKQYPDSIVTFKNDHEDESNNTTAISKVETIIYKEFIDNSYNVLSKIKQRTFWLSEAQIEEIIEYPENYPENYLINPTGREKITIQLVGEWNIIPNLEELKQQEKSEIEQKRKAIDDKLSNTRSLIKNEDLLLTTRIATLLNKLGLGESGRGYSLLEIRKIFSDYVSMDSGEYSDSKISNAIKQLLNDGLIKYTGQTKGMKYCIATLYEKALENYNKKG